MTVDSGESVDYAALRAEQVAALEGCGVSSMGHNHLAAVYSGFPPDDCSIVTPADYKEKFERGQVPETPMAKLRCNLENICGPAAGPSSLRRDFNVTNPSVSPSDNSPNISLANLFNPSGPHS
ncbi:MAG: hypothetical protein IT559_02685 [Alphaproteobacteria bacterium]|nr:hypothetical protein [Alphaproteobacteria bacterium]